MAAFLRGMYPGAVHGFLDPQGFSEHPLGLHTGESRQTWYLSLEALPIKEGLFTRVLYKSTIVIIATAVRFRLPAKIAFALRWAGAFNLSRCFDLLDTEHKKTYYSCFDIGTDFRINAMFKEWIRCRGSKIYEPGDQQSSSLTAKLGSTDVVIFSGLAKGATSSPDLLDRKTTLGFHVVLILLDYGPLEYPSITSVTDYELYRTRFLTLMALADAVIVPSPYVRGLVETACRAWVVRPPAVFIARAPIGLVAGGTEKPVTEALDILSEGHCFAITIMSFKPRKDFYWLLAVWRHAALALGAEVPRLVVILSGGGGAEYFDPAFIDASFAKYIRVVEQPTDAELTWLFTHALFVVHPPSFGGLGTTLVEAANFGKICLCERSEAYDSLPGGQYIVQLDRDLDAWTNAIRTVTSARDTAHAAPASDDLTSQIATFTTTIDDLIKSLILQADPRHT